MLDFPSSPSDGQVYGGWIYQSGVWLQNSTATTPVWEKIAVVTPSNVASQNFTDLGAFRQLRCSGWLRPVTDGVTLILRTSKTNGASYDLGAADYNFIAIYASVGSVAAATATGTGINLNSGQNVGNALNYGIRTTIELAEFNQASPTKALIRSGFVSSSGVIAQSSIEGSQWAAAAIGVTNAFQILLSTAGNIAAGHLVLEGVRG